MNSVLNVEVSCFESYNAPANPKVIRLLTWLTSGKYRAKVEQIRALPDKAQRDKIKATLPAITPSGLFSYRNSESLTRHSGLLCIDIDGKDNRQRNNFANLKTELCQIPNVAYCGLSVSGDGYFVLIPIAYPEQHLSQFRELQRLFWENAKINIDKSCGNIDRLRGYSYDANGYFNHHAKPFAGLYQPPTPAKRNRTDYSPANSTNDATDTRSKVESCLAQIGSKRLDLTTDNKTWFSLGCALANEFGESGRDYYHALSEHYTGYTQTETDTKFDYFLKHRYQYSIGTFFYMCELANILPALPDRQTIPAPAPVAATATRPRIVTRIADFYQDTILRPRESDIERNAYPPYQCTETETYPNGYPPEWDFSQTAYNK